MPAGLDGNPNPVVTPERDAVLAHVVDAVLDRRAATTPFLIAVDGIDGSGKSTFADELACSLAGIDLLAARASIDSFHHPREIRWKRGKASPVGFFLDSHDLPAVRTKLLEPFKRGNGLYVTEIFDEPTNAAVSAQPIQATNNGILIFDGIFAQRSELAEFWDLTIFLDGQERVNQRRLGYIIDDLPEQPIDVVAHVLDWQTKIDRYASGMRFYMDLVNPRQLADVVIDNNDLAKPTILNTFGV